MARVQATPCSELNERDRQTASAAPRPGRSFRPARDVSARVSDRPVRFPLHLLHVRAYDLPAQAGPALAGGAGPALLGFRRQGRAQAAHHGRRAAGAQEHPLAVPQAVAAPWRRPRRGDADDQRQPAGEVRGRAEGRRRAPHQCLARYAEARSVQGDHALGRLRSGDGRHRRGGGGRACRSSSTRSRCGASTRTRSTNCCASPTAAAST